MNEIIKAMEERRSIRNFKPDLPSKEEIDQILEAGLYAASGMGKQAVITLAVTNKKIRDELAEDNRMIGGWGSVCPIALYFSSKGPFPARIS